MYTQVQKIWSLIYIYDLLIHPIYTVFVINNIKSKILCW